MHGAGSSGLGGLGPAKRIHSGVHEDEVESPRRRSVYGPATPGSYGHLIYTLAQGIDLAVTKGWLTEDEGKREFRSHVQVVQEDEVKAERIKALEAELEEREQELLEARARIEATKTRA